MSPCIASVRRGRVRHEQVINRGIGLCSCIILMLVAASHILSGPDLHRDFESRESIIDQRTQSARA